MRSKEDTGQQKSVTLDSKSLMTQGIERREITSTTRGAAHNSCNLKYRIPDYIPIVFHNLSGYDAHLFIKELGRRFNKNDIGVINYFIFFIAENKEKYISFNVKINVKLAGVNIKMVHKCIKIFSLGL